MKYQFVLWSLFFICATARCGDDAAYDQQMQKWNQYISSYSPDYSDSSKDLKPPQTGLLDKPLSLVKAGQPIAVINYSAVEGIVVQTAAEELQFFIQQITGAKLLIRCAIVCTLADTTGSS